jgi:hypothetical protein
MKYWIFAFNLLVLSGCKTANNADGEAATLAARNNPQAEVLKVV